MNAIPSCLVAHQQLQQQPFTGTASKSYPSRPFSANGGWGRTPATDAESLSLKAMRFISRSHQPRPYTKPCLWRLVGLKRQVRLSAAQHTPAAAAQLQTLQDLLLTVRWRPKSRKRAHQQSCSMMHLHECDSKLLGCASAAAAAAFHRNCQQILPITSLVRQQWLGAHAAAADGGDLLSCTSSCFTEA